MPRKIEGKPLPAADIRWLVNRLHVSTSAQEIREDFTRRTQAGCTDSERERIIRYALHVHAHNNQLYYDVVTGRF